jgi:glycosyltransferase involved in cell wall biosynthesis
MKIAMLLSGTGVNGVTNHCRLLADFLHSRGHQILLVHRPSKWIEGQPEFRAVARFETSFAWRAREIIEVGNQILRFDADVIHTHMSAAHAYGAFYRVLGSIPVVATAHAMHIQLHWPFNHHVIATSHEAESFHRKFNFVRKERIETIPNFVDVQFFRPPSEAERIEARSAFSLNFGDFVVGFAGDLIARKRPQDLVAAFAKFAQTNECARLLIAGGPAARAEELKRLAADLGAGNRVIAPGALKNIRQVYWAMDVFAHPSGEETGPLAVLEAAATGLPVVATNVGMVANFVRHDCSGFVVDIGDTTQMAERILTLCLDRRKRIEFSLAARHIAETAFSTEVLGPRIEKALEKVANAGKARRRVIWPYDTVRIPS